MIIDCRKCSGKKTAEMLYQEDSITEKDTITYHFGCLQCNQTFNLTREEIDKNELNNTK